MLGTGTAVTVRTGVGAEKLKWLGPGAVITRKLLPAVVFTGWNKLVIDCTTRTGIGAAVMLWIGGTMLNRAGAGFGGVTAMCGVGAGNVKI